MKTNACRSPNPELLLILVTTLLLLGCGRSVPVSYYQLTASNIDTAIPENPATALLTIGIGPVRLQEHLDRPQIITRTSANQLQLAAGKRWAEPLAENISWVLRDNLSALLATENIILYPWERTPGVDYQLSIDILRCEGTEDGVALLEALWTISDQEGTTLLPQRRSTFRLPAAASDQEVLVRTLSDAVSRLSLEIARAISTLPGPAAGQKTT